MFLSAEGESPDMRIIYSSPSSVNFPSHTLNGNVDGVFFVIQGQSRSSLFLLPSTEMQNFAFVAISDDDALIC